MKRTFITYLLCILFISMASGRATTRANQPGSIVKQSAPLAQVGAQQASLVEVENWTKPQPGWLYVLDPRPNVGEIGGHIWLLDPESGKVMGGIHTGYHPDFALSPDGSHLYIASETHRSEERRVGIECRSR